MPRTLSPPPGSNWPFTRPAVEGDIVGLERFGASAPAAKLFEEFGFTADNVYARAKALLAKGV